MSWRDQGAKRFGLLRRRNAAFLPGIAAIGWLIGIAVAETPDAGIQALLDKESVLNGKCRGGSGDDPGTAAYCDQRDAVFNELKAKGWCYGEEGQAQYQKAWHPCAATGPTRTEQSRE